MEKAKNAKLSIKGLKSIKSGLRIFFLLNWTYGLKAEQVMRFGCPLRYRIFKNILSFSTLCLKAPSAPSGRGGAVNYFHKRSLLKEGFLKKHVFLPTSCSDTYNKKL